MAEQLEVDRQEVLADDVQARGRQEMVDVGDAAGDRVLDRDHAERRPRRPDGGEGVLEGGAGQRLASPGNTSRQAMCGVGAGLALVGDELVRVGMRPSFSVLRPRRQDRAGRARDRAACRRRAARRRRAATSMRMPSSSARSCSSRSRFSSGEGGSATKRVERRAAIGVEADVMVERPLAGGRGGAGEVERPQPAGRDRAADDLDHVGVGALLRRA